MNGNPVVVRGGGSQLVSWTSAGAKFVATESPLAASGPVTVSAMAAFKGSTTLVGSDYEQRFLARVWTSTDGLAWTEVMTTGLDRPADMVAISASPDVLYAAGLFRVGPDPAVGTFHPAIWRSADGQHWQSLTPPADGEGSVTALTTPPGSVIGAMNVDGAGSIWRSLDNGATWTRAAVEVGAQNRNWRIGSIAHLGDRLVGVGETLDDTGIAVLVLVSTDDGATWVNAPQPPLAAGGGEGGASVVAAAGVFWLATSEYNSGFTNPDLCYRDLSACQTGARPVLMRSPDGIEWVEVDLSGLWVSWIERLVDVGDRGMMLVGRAGRSPRLLTWTWPSGSEPPRRPAPQEPRADEPPLAEFDGRLAVGVTYRFPLYIHCGMRLLGNFNDRWWYLVKGSSVWDPEIGTREEPPAHWPIADQYIFGTITLVDADTIEYTIPSGEVIAVYEASADPPQLCA